MATDLTKGNITKHLITFTIPLILGNIFQLAYNAVDSIVIGRFAGNEALAAVGTAEPVMNFLIMGIAGLCVGTSVLMSNFYGAGKYEDLKKEMGTCLRVGGIFSMLLFAGEILASGTILKLMQVPEDILELSVSYLRVIFIGMPFTCLYNIYAAALRSVGDSKTPIRFLAFSSILNGGLDVLFVAGLGLGVFGAGLATDIAESVSAVACVVYVYKKVPALHVSLSDFTPDREFTKKTLRYGSTTALQQCAQPIGKLAIQGMVNTLGVSTIAAFNAVGKIEDFALVPERSVSTSMMTFIAQNDGAEEKERVRKGFWKGMIIETCYFVFICIVLLLFHRQILYLFSTDETILREGGRYFSVMAFFYFFSAMTNGMQGFFRGKKYMKVSLAGSLTQISVRVLFTFLLIPRLGITGIAFACAAGWIAMLILVVGYGIRRGVWKS
ncbi:MAG: MATE family efflux transporter [Clostridium sp.]|nr:MATE family efflux transporter [Clostridium sp.]